MKNNKFIGDNMKKKVLFLSQEIWDLGYNSGMTSFNRILEKANEIFNTIIFKTDEYYVDAGCVKNFKKVTNDFKNRYVNYLVNILSYIKINILYFIYGVLLKEKPDVIYVSSSFPAISGYLLSKYYSVPYIQRQYGTFLFRKLDSLFELVKYHAEVISYLLPADKFIITDDGTYGDKVADFFKISPNKILFLKNGIEKHTRFNKEECRKAILEELNLPVDSFLIISVSRLVGWKRVDRAINAVNMINDKNIFFLVIGDGEKRSYYENIKKNDNIIFLGALPNITVQKYMAGCDVFLSLYDISNLGNPLFEAMNAGLAIITLDNGDTKSIYDNNMILLDCSSEEEIVKNVYEKIFYLKSNAKIRKRIGVEAEAYINGKVLSWEERISIEIKEILYWSNIK
jgi:glycosyltransferase involved in cell wall biosynthesis